MSIMNIFKKTKKCECSHESIKWMNSLCMIAGYKQEGVCLDCGTQMLKDNEGKVSEK